MTKELRTIEHTSVALEFLMYLGGADFEVLGVGLRELDVRTKKERCHQNFLPCFDIEFKVT